MPRLPISVCLSLTSFVWGATAAALSPPPSITDPGRRDVLPQSPSVVGGALGGLVNPAAWATASDVSFWWNDRSFEENALDNWGLSHGGGLGFSAQRRTFAAGEGRLRVHDYQIGLAFGDRGSHFGFAWRWSTGDDEIARHENGLALGTISRFNRHWSLGATSFFSSETSRRNAVVDLGLRPLGATLVTLFGDYSLSDEQRPLDGIWSAGVEVRPVAGVHLGARVREAPGGEDLEFGLNIGLTLGTLGLHVLPGFDKDGDRGSTTYVLRGDPPYRGLPVGDWVFPGSPRYEIIDLQKRRLTYQRDQWFDKERVAWIDLARHLQKVRRDPRVAGIVINLSDTRIRPSILWELRRELEACQAAGKRLVMHFDQLRMGGYWLASIADRLTIDPYGTIELPGVALHRTYMKGLLDKLGIGFEEHRYFRYKSASETFSRSEMSDADREQLGRLVDGIYELFRDGICRGRGLSREQFDTLVEEKVILFPQEAMEAGLVDEVGRFPEVQEWIKKEGGRTTKSRRSAVYADERWGRPPVVSLVYASGICAMDTGIRGRDTSAYLRSLAGRRDVAAVVLRADSPGGLPLPSDLVAEGTQKIREKGKPVVVSQGDVAASGGYWISMGADRILTTPLTLTGSIGVISGWAWDAGLGEKTGFSADGVQRGSHADLFTGIRFPLISGRLPGRNLNDAERERVRAVTMRLYDSFVSAVAEHRDLETSEVRKIGEGRVWIGTDAVERGLCDEVGTLTDAIDTARSLAGLAPGEEILLQEYPPRRRFRLPKIAAGLPGLGLLTSWAWGEKELAAEEEPDYAWEYVRKIAAHPGEPLLLVPPEAVPTGWGAGD